VTIAKGLGGWRRRTGWGQGSEAPLPPSRECASARGWQAHLLAGLLAGLHGMPRGEPGQAGRDVGIAYFVTGIGCDTGQR
jgi:hypothetical protein